MSQKKETLSLLLSLVLTSGLSFAAFWFLMEHWARINNNSSTTNSANQNLTQNPSNNIINRSIKLTQNYQSLDTSGQR